MEIQDRVAVVTGAARGIGRATAVALAEAGARAVALVDLREEALAESADAVRAAGAEALPRAVDVTDLESLRTLFAEVESATGGLDILHNNAGLGEGPPDWPGIEPARSAAIVDVNLRAVILGTQLALPIMKKGGGGCIVQTSSGAAFAPLPPQAVYAATKAGVVHFTKSCVPLHESHGVRVTCVCPGLVDTDMPRESGDGKVADWLEGMWSTTTLLRPEDIADAVLGLIRREDNAGEILTVGNPA